MVCPSSARTQMQLHPTGTVTATPRACPSRDQGSRDRPGHVTPRVSSTGRSGGPGQPACPRGLPFAGWNLLLPCTALGPGLRGRQGSRSVKVHDRRPGPTRVPGRRLGASASVPFAVEAQGSRLGLSRPHPAAGGAPQPHPALHGRPALGAVSELFKIP